MHPDGYDMKYDFEWPKTGADFAKLFAMKNLNLKEIYTDVKEVDGIKYTQGIKFTFYDEANPITFGNFDRISITTAIFKNAE